MIVIVIMIMMTIEFLMLTDTNKYEKKLNYHLKESKCIYKSKRLYINKKNHAAKIQVGDLAGKE